MTPPTWSQVPARAAGLRATKAAKRPPRATDQMIKHVRAFPFRSDRLDNPRPPEVESAERIRRTTTGGHVARAIRGLFINRLPRDYLSRYAPVLTRKNNAGTWRKSFYHVTRIEMTENRRNRPKNVRKPNGVEPPRRLTSTGPPGSDHFLLHDLLDADRSLLRGLVVVGGHPVAACVAHDRIGRDHRPAGRAGDLGFAVGLGLRRDGDLRDGLCHLRHRDGHLRCGLRDRRRRSGRDRLGPQSRGGNRGRGHRFHGDDRPGNRGRRDRLHRLFLRDQLFLPLEESLPFLGDLCACRGEVFLFGGEPLFAVHELAVPTDLRIERRLLVFEELHDLLLPRGNFGLPRGDVLHMADRLRVTARDVLFPPDEGFEALGKFLLARHERVLLGEHLLSRDIEFLLPVGDHPFALLELFLAGPQAFLAPDERVPLFRERGPFLFEDPAVFLDFGGLILKGRLAAPSVRVLGLQALFHFLQCI